MEMALLNSEATCPVFLQVWASTPTISTAFLISPSIKEPGIPWLEKRNGAFGFPCAKHSPFVIYVLTVMTTP